MPATAPITIAIPPIIDIRRALFIKRVPDNVALSNPKPNNATTERKIDACRAVSTDHRRYGKSGMNPARKYEKNIIIAPVIFFRVGVSTPLAYPSAEDSDKKLPADIEKASTKMSTTPVRKIVSLDTAARAIPERSPTVETKLSSTPKTKFLNSDTDRRLCNMALYSTRAAPDILLQRIEVGLFYHFLKLLVLLGEPRVGVQLRKELQDLRYLIFGAHIHFKIHFLPQVGYFSLPVLGDEDHDGKEYRFERDDHSEEAEGEGVEGGVPEESAVPEHPDQKKYCVQNEEGNRAQPGGDIVGDLFRPPRTCRELRAETLREAIGGQTLALVAEVPQGVLEHVHSDSIPRVLARPAAFSYTNAPLRGWDSNPQLTP